MTTSPGQLTSITLHDARPEDEAFLLAVYASTRTSEMALLPWTNEQKDAFVEMQFRAQYSYYREHFQDAAYKLILQNGERVGRIFVLRGKHEIRILDITILPQHRNAGIGTPLIEWLMKEGAETGRVVQVYVESFNPSCRLFERLGFSVVKEDGLNLLLQWQPRQGNRGRRTLSIR